MAKASKKLKNGKVVKGVAEKLEGRSSRNGMKYK